MYTDYGEPRGGDRASVIDGYGRSRGVFMVTAVRGGPSSRRVLLESIDTNYGVSPLWPGDAGAPLSWVQIVFRPGDPIDEPSWDSGSRVHNWRNYVGGRTREIWHLLDRNQRVALALDTEDRAGLEDWE